MPERVRRSSAVSGSVELMAAVNSSLKAFMGSPSSSASVPGANCHTGIRRPHALNAPTKRASLSKPSLRLDWRRASPSSAVLIFGPDPANKLVRHPAPVGTADTLDWCRRDNVLAGLFDGLTYVLAVALLVAHPVREILVQGEFNILVDQDVGKAGTRLGQLGKLNSCARLKLEGVDNEAARSRDASPDRWQINSNEKLTASRRTAADMFGSSVTRVMSRLPYSSVVVTVVVAAGMISRMATSSISALRPS